MDSLPNGNFKLVCVNESGEVATCFLPVTGNHEKITILAEQHAVRCGGGLFYARFMDDGVVLAPTRWKLRKAIRCVNRILAILKVRQHPDQTFIGLISRGFDFLGYVFGAVNGDR